MPFVNPGSFYWQVADSTITAAALKLIWSPTKPDTTEGTDTSEGECLCICAHLNTTHIYVCRWCFRLYDLLRICLGVCATEAQYQYVWQQLSARSQVAVLMRDFFFASIPAKVKGPICKIWPQFYFKMFKKRNNSGDDMSKTSLHCAAEKSAEVPCWKNQHSTKTQHMLVLLVTSMLFLSAGLAC